MYKGKHWRPKGRTLLNDKKNTNGYYWEDPNDPRNFKENEFYTTKGNSGTIEQEKPKMLTIPEIKDNRTAAVKRVDDLTNVHLDTIVNGGTDSQIYVAKQNLDNAKKEVENYDLELTAAYGLGPNGYWNKANELDTIVNEAGHKPVATGQTATPPAVQPRTSTAPMTNAELDNLVNNPEGYKPRQTREVKPKTTTTATPSTKSTVPATHLDLVIAQTLDEFVNNPNMSENRKDELNTQLSKLTADRDVLRWKAQQSGRPTIENYETQEKYVTNEKNFALDDIVNGIGNGSLQQGTDEWYAAHKKVSDFDNQLRALNMGKMGQLDGEKAVTAEEHTASANAPRTGGGDRVGMSFSADNDVPMYVGLDDEETQNAEEQDDYSGLTSEELDDKKQEETNIFIEENNANREADKQFLKEDIISRNMKLYNEAMTAAKFGDFSKLNTLKTFVFNGKVVGNVSPEHLKAKLITYALGAENYEQLCKDIDVQYDKVEAEGVKAIDDEFKPYFESAAVVDQLGADYSVMDWTNDSVDLSIDNSSIISNIDTQIQDLKNYAADLEVMGRFKEIYSIRDDIKALENRKRELEQYNETYDIAISANLEGLDALQLFMRADYDTQTLINETNSEIEKLMPMLKQAEQGAIHDGLTYFNDALKEWEEGDDKIIESIFTETYGGKPYDPKNLDINVLRDDYLKFKWDSIGLEEEFIQPLIDARDERIKEHGELIGTYLQEKMNYEETDTGFNLEISPELIQYTISYAEEKEAGYKNGAGITNMAGIATGALAAVTGAGVAVGIIIGIATYLVSDDLNTQANQWENLANELEHHMDTDKPLEISIIGDKVFVNEIDDNN